MQILMTLELLITIEVYERRKTRVTNMRDKVIKKKSRMKMKAISH
jgi:hypothetical protein